MTKKELKEIVNTQFGAENAELFFPIVLDIVRRSIKQNATNWSVTDVSFRHGGSLEEECIRRGYRKNTTGEYVANSYRNNFGWKNTYYQEGSLNITIPEQLAFDRYNASK